MAETEPRKETVNPEVKDLQALQICGDGIKVVSQTPRSDRRQPPIPINGISEEDISLAKWWEA